MLAGKEIIEQLVKLQGVIRDRKQALDAVVHRSSVHNPWFTERNIYRALDNIADRFLDRESLELWIGRYPVPVHAPKIIGLIMAGNIPAVGFHDLLSVLVSGHHAQIKLSEKDPYLIPWIVETLYAPLRKRVSIVPKLAGFDAVIATGSNNSARYFEQYFGTCPHVIRKNRNSVAVLDGNETPEQLDRFAADVFSYFGLGCRNVSKICVPEGFDFDPLVRALDSYRELANHNKYKNNIDFNAALNILNKVPNISLPHLTMIENAEIISRIGTLHYTYYQDLKSLVAKLDADADMIQCIVTGIPLEPVRIPVVAFGETQCPRLDDYADAVDIMQFLSSL